MSNRDFLKPTKPVFMTDEEVQAALANMERDTSIDTSPSMDRYDLASLVSVTFRDKHTSYLQTHPKVNPQHYLSNLRAVLRKR